MKPKLLIVEDEEAIRTELRSALRDDFTLVFAEGRAEALSALACEQAGGRQPRPRHAAPSGELGVRAGDARPDHEDRAGHQGRGRQRERRPRQRDSLGPARRVRLPSEAGPAARPEGRAPAGGPSRDARGRSREARERRPRSSSPTCWDTPPRCARSSRS
jgi:hypothetical protein